MAGDREFRWWSAAAAGRWEDEYTTPWATSTPRRGNLKRSSSEFQREETARSHSSNACPAWRSSNPPSGTSQCQYRPRQLASLGTVYCRRSIRHPSRACSNSRLHMLQLQYSMLIQICRRSETQHDRTLKGKKNSCTRHRSLSHISKQEFTNKLHGLLRQRNLTPSYTFTT